MRDVDLYQTLKGVCFFEGIPAASTNHDGDSYQTLKGVCFFEGGCSATSSPCGRTDTRR